MQLSLWTPSKEGAISGGNQAAAGEADRFAHAWDAMRHDSSIQFNLAPQPQPPKMPSWLEAFFRWLGDTLRPVGRALEWLGSFFPNAPVARALLWIVIAAGTAVLIWTLYNRIRHGEWRFRLPRRRATADPPAEEDWAPEEAGARSWLEEADALAREGRFAEAIHHLLFRSIEDIARRRPSLVHPALTSRELAAAQGIPGRARELFSAIARVVERSLFGGRLVGEGDWREARESYAEFALAGAWKG